MAGEAVQNRIIHDMIQALLTLLPQKALFVACTVAVALTAVQAVGLMVEVTEPVYMISNFFCRILTISKKSAIL